MPIYEFEYQACSCVSEHIMKISDKNPEACPSCHASGGLKKLMSRSSFVLKGKGWYETDFKDPPKKSEGSKNTSVSPKESSTSKAQESSKETKKEGASCPKAASSSKQESTLDSSASPA